MIKNTRNFLNIKTKKTKDEEKKANYEYLAELYEEIVSTWNKIYICCDSGDAVLAYISGTCLQDELKESSRENGLDKFNLMDAYNPKHLEKFKERAVELQKKFVKIIEENGVNIEEYDTVEEFIKNN
ncbi:hypothetical protein [Clostridium hydrogenum]|uniref:hypothetical protein n=1 Tax=Clostridium hydrogenum TaxID=2855764 RepID=UPI001F391D47|nr:hypothetical protein [Clostridium hydrogenum]